MSEATPVVDPPTKSRQQDPTALTTEQLLHETDHLEKLFQAKLDGIVGIISARLDAMDKALSLVNEYPTEVERAIKQLKDLHEEKFASLHLILKERDQRTIILTDSQKEARDKSESSLTRQVESIDAQIATVSRVLDSKIDDLKTRLQMVEGRM